MDDTSAPVEAAEHAEEALETVVNFEFPSEFSDDLFQMLSNMAAVEVFTFAALLILIGVVLALVFTSSVKKV